MPDRLTYGSYLHIDELVALQQPQSQPAHHDEMLFIIIHQVYELWFKQMLHELEAAMRYLAADDPLRTTRALGRVHTIQRVLEQQIDVLETMTPHEFNAFRELLNPASGFQSAQFRELEFLCGVGKTGYLAHLEHNNAERARLERRLGEPTLYDALKAFLKRRGAHRVADEIRARVERCKPVAQSRRRSCDHPAGIPPPSFVRTSQSSGKNFFSSVVCR